MQTQVHTVGVDKRWTEFQNTQVFMWSFERLDNSRNWVGHLDREKKNRGNSWKWSLLDFPSHAQLIAVMQPFVF